MPGNWLPPFTDNLKYHLRSVKALDHNSLVYLNLIQRNNKPVVCVIPLKRTGFKGSKYLAGAFKHIQFNFNRPYRRDFAAGPYRYL
jgi:hypothetical protein